MIAKILRDVVAFLPSKVIPALSGLAMTLLLPRMMPRQELGSYLITLTTLTLIAGFCSSWLFTIVLRFSSIMCQQELRHVLRRYVVASLVAAALLWIGIHFFARSIEASWMLMTAGLLWLLAQLPFDYQTGWLRSTRQVSRYTNSIIIRNLGGLLLGLLFLSVWGRTAELVVLGSAMAAGIGAAIAALGDRAAGAKPSAATDQPIGRSALLRYGGPAAVASVVITGLSLADRYVVRSLLGLEAVGVYGVSYDLAEKTIFFANSMLLLSSSVVGFQLFEREGEVHAVQYLGRLMWLYLVVVVPTAGLMITHAELVVESLLGPGFREGPAVFGIVTASGVLVGVLHRYSLLLSFHKRTDAILYCSLAALAANIAGCFALIPRYGLRGAAIATFIGYFVWLVTIRVTAARYLVPRFPLRSFARILLATVIATATSALLARIIPLTGSLGVLVLVGAAGAAIYVAMIVAIGEIPLAQIVSFFRRARIAEPSR